MHVHETCVTSIFNCTCLFVCLFVCKWQQFYMNHKALINRFVWPGLSFCARLNIKPCPDLDLSSRPCHYWLTNNQFFWLNIDIIVTVIRIALVLGSTWLKSAVDVRVSCVTVASLTKLNTDTSETTERISEEAVGVCSTWSAGKKTLAVALGFDLVYSLPRL